MQAPFTDNINYVKEPLKSFNLISIYYISKCRAIKTGNEKAYIFGKNALLELTIIQ